MIILIHSSDRQMLIDAFPGRATICSPVDDYLEGARKWWKEVYVEKGLRLRPWDNIQIRLQDCPSWSRRETPELVSQGYEVRRRSYTKIHVVNCAGLLLDLYLYQRTTRAAAHWTHAITMMPSSGCAMAKITDERTDRQSN